MGYSSGRAGGRAFVRYADLVELQSITDARSAGVFSMDRMLVLARNGKSWTIAPADAEGFLAAVGMRCPHLERKGSGLGPPLSSPTVW